MVAVPVGSRQACGLLKKEAGDCVCLAMPEPFRGVGVWYMDFGQTTDGEVEDLLERSRRLRGQVGGALEEIRRGQGP